MTSILFLAKADDRNAQEAYVFLKNNFQQVDGHFGNWGEPLPHADELHWMQPDYTISYLSRWIVPQSIISNTKIAALNFHPAPPEYPGFAPNNFALYEEAKDFGVTCHHMEAKVDTGPIVAVKRFPIFTSDSIETLQQRTYTNQLALFYEVISTILRGDPLLTTTDKWKETAYTRKQFEQLNHINMDMDKKEVERRIRATSFGKFQPAIELHGYKFELRVK